MTTPSTANSKDPGGNVLPVMERGATGSGGTHSVVKGEAAPRLPHERDESSDSGTGAPRDVMKKAADDLLDGHSDVPRGPKTQEQYSELTAQAQREAEPKADSPGNPGQVSRGQGEPVMTQEFKPLDPGRVMTSDPTEIGYWCDEFNCTEAQLKAAVERVGEHVTAVREALAPVIRRET